MKNAVRAELYKLRHDRLLWFVPALYFAVGLYAGFFDHAIMDTYKGLELFSLTEVANVFLSFAVTVMVGYVIGGDFSRRTIQNVLSVGVDKKSYYFSRLFVEGILTGALFMITGLTHLICHLAWPQGRTETQIVYLWQKLIVYMVVVLLQLLAYVSVMNAVCYFVKKQLTAVVLAIGVVYFEMVIRQAAAINGLVYIQELIDHTPTNAMRGMFAFAFYDQVLTGGFMKYGVSAIVIIIISSVAGYIKFFYDKGQ